MDTWVGRPTWVIGHRVTLLDTVGDYAMLEIVTAADIPRPPPHYHAGFPEFFYIAEGELEVRMGDDWRRLEQGRSLSIPAGVVHTFRNPGRKPTRWLTGFSPRGFERFFAAFGIAADRPDAQAASVAPALLERLAREAAGVDMVITGSGPTG